MLPANEVLSFDSTKFILLLYCAHLCVPLFFINFIVLCCKKKMKDPPKSIIEDPPSDMISKAAVKHKGVKGKKAVTKQKKVKGKTAVIKQKTVKGKTTRRR
uniref:Candidate secreted effector n=3 Tax=Meloidogyne TaxID=189290 RepID=A0A914KX49_MELIC|nr:unnamed protein product [Meloidogyne enterolobii]